MKSLFYFVGLVLISAVKVSSLSCIICNSVEDPKCGHGDEVDQKAYLKPCNTTEEHFKRQLPALLDNSSYKFCRKMVTVVDFDVNENKAGERIKRTCGWDDSEEKYNDACYYRAGLGGRITVCTCKTEGCNSSSLIQHSTALVLAMIITFFAFGNLKGRA